MTLSSMPVVGAVITCMSEIAPENINWLWPGFIALGKVSMLMGDPSVGKTMLTLDMAARITNGSPWPIDNSCPPMGDVLLVSNEDDPADTLRPRLDATKANVTRIHHLSMINTKKGANVKGRLFSLKDDLDELGKFLTSHPDCKLIIIDPITAYLGGSDGHNNADVRSLLTPLAVLARTYKVAILCITHLNKGEHRNALNRMSGSIAFGALARFVFVVVKDQENPDRRLVLQAKNNIAEDIKGMAFTIKNIDGLPSIIWEDKYIAISLEEAFSCEKKHTSSVLDDAIEWLTDVLADGRINRENLTRLSQEKGFSVATMRRAKKQVGILTCREGFGENGIYWYELPKSLNDPKDAQPVG